MQAVPAELKDSGGVAACLTDPHGGCAHHLWTFSGLIPDFRFGELFPRVRFIVTDRVTDSRDVVRFYNERGTAE